MAIRVDRPRFRGIFGRMRVEAPPAEEFLDAFEDTLDGAQEGLATTQDLAIAVAEIKSDAAEREARLTQMFVLSMAVILSGIAIATAILLGLLL